MKKPKDYGGATQLCFKPEIKLCPHCSSKLKRSHKTWEKDIFSLKRTLHVTSWAHRCANKACPRPQAVYRSAKAELLSLKYYQFGIDVIAQVGHLRFNEHHTIDTATQTLKATFKLNICRSEVDLLSQVYLALTTADRQQNAAYLDKIRGNGYIVLALDGVQPEKGNETLWILKDALTGETLLARNLKSSDKESIASLLREVKALGIPVKAVISDGQISIRLAVAQEFPGVLHQLCHFHYLRNIANPIADMDRALKVDLKKRVRNIKAIEHRAASRIDPHAQMILQYCGAIRWALLDDGVYPLKPGGLRLYQRLRSIKRSIGRANKEKPDGDLDKLLGVLGVVDEFRLRHRQVKRLFGLIFEAAIILGQEAKAAKVEADMLGYFDRLGKLRFRMKEDRAAVCNILKYTASYWEGLFFHYDDEQIPRTNNDLERFIRRLKSGHRKTTGRAGCQGFVVRYGAYVALLDWSLSGEQMLSRLRGVRYGGFRERFVEIRGFRCRMSVRRRLTGSLRGFLSILERQWLKI